MITFEHMNLVQDVIRDTPIPRFVKVRQKFSVKRENDIPGCIRRGMEERRLFERILPGQRVAITVGSRQIANMSAIVKELVDICRERGAVPYLFPSMGSHGGGTAEGQAAFLRHYGITEETMGAEIDASMDVTQIGTIRDGTPVYVASHLLRADAIIIMNRIKAHPGFSGAIESGLTKMSVIGFGKRIGAESMHRIGAQGMSARLAEAAAIIFEKIPVCFGVGVIENAYDETAEIHCIPAECIPQEEPPLLIRAKAYMPRIILKRGSVLTIHITNESRNLSLLWSPRKNLKCIQIRIQIHIRVLILCKSLDGRTVKHTSVIQRFFQLVCRDCYIFHHSIYICKLKPDKAHILFFYKSVYVSFCIVSH